MLNYPQSLIRQLVLFALKFNLIYYYILYYYITDKIVTNLSSFIIIAIIKVCSHEFLCGHGIVFG